MISDSDFQKELETAVDAAREACELMESYSQTVQVKDRKGSFNDVLTEADEQCQELIENILMEKFPEDGFKAEELDEEKQKDRMWVVDPIDGTSNFLKDFEYYCTSIALKVKDEVKISVIMSPESALDILWFAVEDEGAYISETRSIEDSEHMNVSEQNSLEGAMVTSKRKNEVEGQPLFDSKVNARLVENDAMIRIVDAGALSTARVAEGVFDGFISGIESEWDYIAGKLMIEEAGGQIRDNDSHLDGRTMVVASNGSIQEDLEQVADHHLQDI
jgi:myo-inositol-1(or 4)-monophosphatase